LAYGSSLVKRTHRIVVAEVGLDGGTSPNRRSRTTTTSLRPDAIDQYAKSERE